MLTIRKTTPRHTEVFSVPLHERQPLQGAAKVIERAAWLLSDVMNIVPFVVLGWLAGPFDEDEEQTR